MCKSDIIGNLSNIANVTTTFWEKKTFVVFPSQLRKCNKEKNVFVPCSKMPIIVLLHTSAIREQSKNRNYNL